MNVNVKVKEKVKVMWKWMWKRIRNCEFTFTWHLLLHSLSQLIFTLIFTFVFPFTVAWYFSTLCDLLSMHEFMCWLAFLIYKCKHLAMSFDYNFPLYLFNFDFGVCHFTFDFHFLILASNFVRFVLTFKFGLLLSIDNLCLLILVFLL